MNVELTTEQLKYLHYLEQHKITKPMPEYITQNKAYGMFGRSNVERWVEKRKVQRYKRPATIEYKLSELTQAAENIQDYL